MHIFMIFNSVLLKKANFLTLLTIQFKFILYSAFHNMPFKQCISNDVFHVLNLNLLQHLC